MSKLAAAPDIDFRAAKRFSALVALVALIGLSLVAGVNVAADPTGEFDTGWLPPLSESTRDIKYRRFKTLPRDTTSLVFGSSRCLRIEPEHLEGWLSGPAYNAAVNTADALDFHAFLSLALVEHELPIRDIVLGIDVEAFSPTRGPHRNLIANHRLIDLIPSEFRPMRPGGMRYFSALSADKAKLSFKALNFEFAKGWPERADVLDERGVRVYRRIDREMADGSYDLAAVIDEAKIGYREVFNNFPHLDKVDLNALWALFDRCDKAGIRVHCFLTPLHPELRRVLLKDTMMGEREAELLALVRAQCAKRGYRFFDASEI
ncbi:MAG: hypothetical protein KDB07_07470, partial [Planctomycetes bacterium]|nr:hypothetical protein [Planctomycetota bacterium]